MDFAIGFIAGACSLGALAYYLKREFIIQRTSEEDLLNELKQREDFKKHIEAKIREISQKGH